MRRKIESASYFRREAEICEDSNDQEIDICDSHKLHNQAFWNKGDQRISKARN